LGITTEDSIAAMRRPLSSHPVVFDEIHQEVAKSERSTLLSTLGTLLEIVEALGKDIAERTKALEKGVEDVQKNGTDVPCIFEWGAIDCAR
jgi:glutamine phosphoribosylpyrophosphate amidotransferase